ncbi:unnamed protein product [Orchesella dallaii]|uniref:kynurenine--oxoglutarate transaminase n=1 Tax=Orchesella dallaii TaxID=48710 RepID=A0ABP1PQ63_9HEXA
MAGTTSRFQVDEKYKGLESNIWIELNTLNDDLGNCVNLGQGFPDYQPALHIVEHLAAVCKPDPELYAFHQYARAFGHPRLAKALATLYTRLVGVQIDWASEVLVTGGAYGALFYTIMSNIGKGDEVIIVEPYFDCYEPMVLLAGGTPVYIPLKPDENSGDSTSSAQWKLDMKELSSLFNAKTKAIILNTPNNPLGKVFSREELTDIARLCMKHDVLVISDEVYEWIVYGEEEHIRIASLPGMWERTVTIGSAGKTFSLTGWKLGWAYGPASLMRNLQIAHQNCTYMCQTPEQEAVGAALENELELLGKPTSYFHQMRKELTLKREQLSKAISDAGMTPILPQGGYFILAKWTSLKKKIGKELESQGEKLKAWPYEDMKFAIWLAKNKQLLGIPPSAFYSLPHKHLGGDYIRFNFFKRKETLEKADNILRALKES